MNAKPRLWSVGAVAVVLVGVWPASHTRAQAVQTSPGTSLAGLWTLNKDLSDQSPDASQLGRQSGDRPSGGGGGGRRRGGFGGGGFGGGGYGGGGTSGSTSSDDRERMVEAMRDLTNPSNRLTITNADKMVLITTAEGRVTRLSTDGKKVKDENTKIERKTKWDGGKLVSEINGIGRGTITQSYELDSEHHQLVVAVQMQNPRTNQPMTFKHVYDANSQEDGK